MYKLDKTVSKITPHEDAEKDKKFFDDTSLSERLQQTWWLTWMAYMGKHR
jgi:hypothetical protein